MHNTYITGTFKIRREDTNFVVIYEWSESVLTLSVCYNLQTHITKSAGSFVIG